MEILAHFNPKSKQTQLLDDHLVRTAENASNIGRKIEFKYTSILLGLLHDLGKRDPVFQSYIRGKYKGLVNHSSAGSRFIFDLIVSSDSIEDFEKIEFHYYVYILAYTIQAHHGLYDCINIEKNTYELFRKIKYIEDQNNSNISYNYDLVKNYGEEVSKIAEDIFGENLEQLLALGFKEFVSSMEKLEINIKDNKSNFFNYNISLYTRLFLSILKSADVKDTINSFDLIIKDKDYSGVEEEFFNRVEEKYSSFKDKTTASILNSIRTNISEEIKSRAVEDGPGIYRLDLPTGAGKTLVSLRYAAGQMKFKNKDRFFYISPFLSILEQNSAEIREVLMSDKNIIEHHSNIVNLKRMEEDDDENPEILNQEYLLDTWDSPCVLTTMVQFFNTLYKGKSANLRRFASLINSVIIIDEIQSVPIKVTYHMNLIFNFLKRVMNCNIVLCTATQPDYNNQNILYKMDYGDIDGNNPSLYNLSEEDRKVFKRVRVYYIQKNKENKYMDNTSLINHIYETSNTEEATILSISNTKAQALYLYKSFIKANEVDKRVDESNIYYLSTNLYPAHRRKIIKEVKEKLSFGLKVVLFSTQIVEAGVDVDFKYLYRSLAGIDSIIQAAGRCNREGKNDYGIVYIYNTEEEKLSSLKDIFYKKEITKRILNIVDTSESEIDLHKLNDLFFNNYFSNHKDDMYFVPVNYDKLTNKLGLFDELSNNYYGNIQSNIPLLLKQKFKTVAQNFNLIENEDTLDMIVHDFQDEHCNELVSALEESLADYDFKQVKRLLKELQPYTISVFKTSKFIEKCWVSKDYRILIYKEAYERKFGLNDEMLTLRI